MEVCFHVLLQKVRVVTNPGTPSVWSEYTFFRYFEDVHLVTSEVQQIYVSLREAEF